MIIAGTSSCLSTSSSKNLLSCSSSLFRSAISVRDPIDFIALLTSAAVGRRLASILIVVMMMMMMMMMIMVMTMENMV